MGGDGHDTDRVEMVKQFWNSQETLLLPRDRTVEQHIRMLAGQHWTVWNNVLGRWVDLSRYLSDEERRWRFMPVINRVFHWYMITHSRLTENPPIVNWQPGNGDRESAELAEVMDVAFKHIWNDANMIDVMHRMAAWLIPGGSAFLKSRIDPLKGPPRPFEAPAMLSLLDGNGNVVNDVSGNPIQKFVPSAPYGPDGEPVVAFNESGDIVPVPGPNGGTPHIDYEGAIVVDAGSCLEFRGEWGPKPWYQKRVHCQKSLLDPRELYETFGVDVEPTIMGEDASNVSRLRRMLRGSGWYGAAAKPDMFSDSGQETAELVEVYEFWQAPSRFPGMLRSEEDPGGRLTIVAGNQCIRDGQRYADFQYTSPIRRFDFVGLPGRPSGTSPMEMMAGMNRTYNRLNAQVLAHATLVGNPIRVVDLSTGIQKGQLTNEPGQTVYADMEGGPGDPIRYIRPPELTRDVWRSIELLRTEMNELGNVEGAEGRPPTMDASGKLVTELRINSDRFIAPTARGMVPVLARMAEDWRTILPIIWDQEKLIRVAGTDIIGQTIMVYPKVLEQGRVMVVPDVESMVPEGRGEKQTRVWLQYQGGLLGAPGSSEARESFYDNIGYPHLSRLTRPGGEDRVMAEHIKAALLQGSPAAAIPFYPWYDAQIHRFVLERFLKLPEFTRLDEDVKLQFVLFWQKIIIAQQAALQLAVDAQGIADVITGQGAADVQRELMDRNPDLVPPEEDAAGQGQSQAAS